MSSYELRDYQVEGVEFLHSHKRAMLNDAPGLGKTIQATFAAEPPVLVSAPNYLVPQWQEWLEDELHYDSKAAIGDKFDRLRVLKSGQDWTVTNHEMLSTLPDDFMDLAEGGRWRTVIIDESHHLKSHRGLRSKTMVKVADPRWTERVYELTATPVKREIDDFFMQLRILQPDIFTSYNHFVRTFCIYDEDRYGVQVLGAKSTMLPELQELLSVLRLGRSYADVGRSLPPVVERYIPIELTPGQRELYDDVLDYWRVRDETEELSYNSYMEAYHSIRKHLTGYLKTEAVKDLIEDEGVHVIFTWYKPTAEAIATRVPDCELATGDFTVEERRTRALSGNNVAATISSLSEGIDLSHARNVIFAEEDWTPGSNYQALSRVVRERQHESNDEPVIVNYVHCKGTIDEVIHRRSKSRAGTVKEVVKESLYL